MQLKTLAKKSLLLLLLGYAQSLFLPLFPIRLSNLLCLFLSLVMAECCLVATVLGYLLSFKRNKSMHLWGKRGSDSLSDLYYSEEGLVPAPRAAWPRRSFPTVTVAKLWKLLPEEKRLRWDHCRQLPQVFPLPSEGMRRAGNNAIPGPTFWASEKGGVKRGLAG